MRRSRMACRNLSLGERVRRQSQSQRKRQHRDAHRVAYKSAIFEGPTLFYRWISRPRQLLMKATTKIKLGRPTTAFRMPDGRLATWQQRLEMLRLVKIRFGCFGQKGAPVAVF